MSFNEIGTTLSRRRSPLLQHKCSYPFTAPLPFHLSAPALPSKYFEMQDILKKVKFIPGMTIRKEIRTLIDHRKTNDP